MRFLLLLIFLPTYLAAQSPFLQATAKCKDGLLPTRYQFNKAGEHSYDTIPVDCARSIYAFNVGYQTADSNDMKFTIVTFNLFVRHHGQMSVITSRNDVTHEMKTILSQVESGDEIDFNSIQVKSSAGAYYSTEPLGYIVR